MPLAYGFVLFALTWMLFSVEPFFDMSWFDQMLGLSKTETVIAVMFFIVGNLIGAIAQAASRTAKAQAS